MRAILSFLIFSAFLQAKAQQPTTQQFKEDFEHLWNTIEKKYCYWDKKSTDWQKVKHVYAAQLDTIKTKWHFTLLLEKVLNELYDAHTSLSTNTSESQRLVPSGADIWASFKNNVPTITEVRIGFGAYRSGLKAGMQIVAINDIPIEEAIKPFLPKALLKADGEAKNYALRIALAGRHDTKRKITVRDNDKVIDFYPDEPDMSIAKVPYNSIIESNILSRNIGYIRINNQLWNNALISTFDSVLNSMMQTSALILDLRETPAGGNSTVARAIMGRFISKEGFYQAHELTAEEKQFGVRRSWKELVSPRAQTYTKPLAVLVNHWTGSMGEGITIGFDALKRATIIGTEMAGLNGAIYSYQLPNTKIGFNIPVEKLFHVNGTPRELFKPAVQVDLLLQKDNQDLILDTALDYFRKTKIK